MSAPATAPAGASPKVTFPARSSVSIIYGDLLVGVVVPAKSPIEDYFESLVELVDSGLQSRGFAPMQSPPGSYELHVVTGQRLDMSRSLDDLGIEDGMALVLEPVSTGESFEPQIEALSTALASTAKGLGRRPEVICEECGHTASEKQIAKLLSARVDVMFTPVSALTAAHTAIAIIAMAVTVIAALVLRARTFTDSWVPAAVVGGVGVVMLTGAVVTLRLWPDRRDVFSGFGWPAVGAFAVAGASAAPGALGAPHAMIGVIVIALGAITISVLTRSQTAVATGVVTFAALLGLMAGLRTWQPVTPRVLGIVVLLLLVWLIRYAPQIALWVVRVRPPYFGSITGRDLFDHREGQPVDTVTPSGADQSDEEDELTDISERGADLRRTVRYLNAVQVGICVAVAAMLPIVTWMVLSPGHGEQWKSEVLCGLVAGVFITQGRGFSARVQPVALVLGSCTAVMAGVLKYALASPGDTAGGLLIPAAVIFVFAACGVAAGLLVPVTKFVPQVRQAVEWLEILALAVILVDGAYVGGLFTWFRNL